jgi:alkylation response protein AidB-like acyl-CoA dehydrogenase
MDLAFTPAQRALQQRTRDLVQAAIGPRAVEVDRSGRPAAENLSDLHRAGLLAAPAPEAFGGHGLGIGGDYLGLYVVIEELARGCPSTSLLYLINAGNVNRVNVMGTPEQVRRFNREFVEQGATIASVNSGFAGLGDPGVVSLEDVDTVADRGEGGWIINGRKKFGSGAGTFTYYLTMTSIRGETDRRRSLIVPLIHKDNPGVIVHESWDQMGMRGSSTNSAEFRNCRVPDEDVLGRPGDMWKAGNMFGQLFHASFAANYLGTAQGAFDFALDYVKTQIPDRAYRQSPSVRKDPYVQYRFAEMDISLEASRLLLYKAALLQGQAERAGNEEQVESYIAAHRARVFAADTALRVTSDVFYVAGLRATAKTYSLDRYWRDVRTYTLHDPLDHRKGIVGAYLLGAETPNPGAF